jgi:hypothetical protein
MSLELGQVPWIIDLSIGIRTRDLEHGMLEVFIGKGYYLQYQKNYQILFEFSGIAGGQIGGRWHRTSMRIHIFLWKRE